jgi:4'-phosphopantetheinyl transferase
MCHVSSGEAAVIYAAARSDPMEPLAIGEVRVWIARLRVAAEALDALWCLLSRDERERAGRFHFPRDRGRFVVCRGVLRTLLGHQLDVPPAHVRFVYGPYGKPAVRADGATVRFNVSHSDDLALYALARDREVGIDVERIRHTFATSDIAERFFSRSERERLRRMPEEARVRAFFHCWTRKEAYVKAVGDGLSLSLDRFDVSVDPDHPALLRLHGGDDRARWALYDLRAAPAYAAALAVRPESECVRMAWWG